MCRIPEAVCDMGVCVCVGSDVHINFNNSFDKSIDGTRYQVQKGTRVFVLWIVMPWSNASWSIGVPGYSCLISVCPTCIHLVICMSL